MGETCNTSVPLNVLQRRFDRAQLPQSERAQPLISQAQFPGPSAQGCLFRGFQGVNYKCGLVLPLSFIGPSARNHFAPFWRFEKFGYDHPSAATF